MPLSTTVIELRVDCITENFGRVKRWCLGDMGGVGYCVEFFRQKNIHKLFIDSWRRLWYTRVSLYQYGLYIWAVCPICRHFAARKKMKKNQNTPLHISAGCDRLCGVDTTIGPTHRTLEIESSACSINGRVCASW